MTDIKKRADAILLEWQLRLAAARAALERAKKETPCSPPQQ